MSLLVFHKRSNSGRMYIELAIMIVLGEGSGAIKKEPLTS